MIPFFTRWLWLSWTQLVYVSCRNVILMIWGNIFKIELLLGEGRGGVCRHWSTSHRSYLHSFEAVCESYVNNSWGGISVSENSLEERGIQSIWKDSFWSLKWHSWSWRGGDKLGSGKSKPLNEHSYQVFSPLSEGSCGILVEGFQSTLSFFYFSFLELCIADI